MEPSDVLVVNVQRTYRTSIRQEKINDDIVFGPPLAIELPTGEIMEYEPISALQHIGPPGSGHYVTYLLHNGKWFIIDSNKAIREAKGKEDIGVCQIFLFKKKSL